LTAGEKRGHGAAKPTTISTRPMSFPRGRIGTAELLARTGISKTTFFTKLRHDPYWIDRLDMRIDHRGRLHFADEAGLQELLAACMGRRAESRSSRADNLARPCGTCGEPVNVKQKLCSICRDATHG
jgi:hypothetical protein